MKHINMILFNVLNYVKQPPDKKQSVSQQCCSARQAGYSMLELLVAMTIGVLVLGSAIAMQVSNRGSFRATTSELEMKTSAKMAAEFIGTSLRGVGAMGCRTVDAFQGIQSANRQAETESAYNIVLNSTNTDIKYLADANFNAGHEILGYEAIGSAWNPVPATELKLDRMTPGSDAITLRGGVGQTYVIANGRSYGQASYPLAVKAGTDIEVTAGNYAVASTCKNAEVFKVTGVGADGIGRGAGSGLNSNSQGVTTQRYGIGREDFAELRRVATTSYYIGNNLRGTPTLYRNIDGISSPLVEGVEHMMLEYGIEDNAVLRNVASRYLTADEIQKSCVVTPGAPLSVPLPKGCLWPSVVSVRVSFIMRSRDEILGKKVQKSYT